MTVVPSDVLEAQQRQASQARPLKRCAPTWDGEDTAPVDCWSRPPAAGFAATLKAATLQPFQTQAGPGALSVTHAAQSLQGSCPGTYGSSSSRSQTVRVAAASANGADGWGPATWEQPCPPLGVDTHAIAASCQSTQWGGASALGLAGVSLAGASLDRASAAARWLGAALSGFDAGARQSSAPSSDLGAAAAAHAREPPQCRKFRTLIGPVCL